MIRRVFEENVLDNTTDASHVNLCMTNPPKADPANPYGTSSDSVKENQEFDSIYRSTHMKEDISTENSTSALGKHLCGRRPPMSDSYKSTSTESTLGFGAPRGVSVRDAGTSPAAYKNRGKEPIVGNR